MSKVALQAGIGRAALVSALALAGGCQPTAFERGSAAMVRTELYLGMASKKGDVTDRELTVFLQEVVTPRFPDGYTLIPATGYYRAASGTQRERTVVLVVIRPATKASDEAVEEIRREYKLRFDQEATLRADGAVRAEVR